MENGKHSVETATTRGFVTSENFNKIINKESNWKCREEQKMYLQKRTKMRSRQQIICRLHRSSEIRLFLPYPTGNLYSSKKACLSVLVHFRTNDVDIVTNECIRRLARM